MKDLSIGLSHKVRPTKDTLDRVLDGELVLLNVQSGNYYSIDEIGTTMWEALISSDCIGDAIDRVGESYDVSREQIERDVIRLVAELRGEGLVEISPP